MSWERTGWCDTKRRLDANQRRESDWARLLLSGVAFFVWSSVVTGEQFVCPPCCHTGLGKKKVPALESPNQSTPFYVSFQELKSMWYAGQFCKSNLVVNCVVFSLNSKSGKQI